MVETATTKGARKGSQPAALPIRSTWQTGYGIHLVGLALGDVFVTGAGLSQSEAEYRARLKFERARGQEKR